MCDQMSLFPNECDLTRVEKVGNEKGEIFCGSRAKRWGFMNNQSHASLRGYFS